MNIFRYLPSTLLTLPFFLSVSTTKAQDLKFTLESAKSIDTTNCVMPERREIRRDNISPSISSFSSHPPVKPISAGESFSIDLDESNWLLPENYRSGIGQYLHTDSLLLEGLELKDIGRKKGENDTVGLSLNFLLINKTKEYKESMNQDIESIKKWIKEQYINLYYLFLTVYPFDQNDYGQTTTVTILKNTEHGVEIVINYKKL